MMVWSPWHARSARDSGKERGDHPCVALLKTLMRARKASTSPLLMASVSAVFFGVSSDLWDSIFSGTSSHLCHIFSLGSIPGMSCKEFNYLYIKYCPLGTKHLSSLSLETGQRASWWDRRLVELLAPHGIPGDSLACLCMSLLPGTACVQVCSAPSAAPTSGEWHTAALRHPCLLGAAENSWELQQILPLLCSCSSHPISHKLCIISHSRGSDHPCPMLQVWKQLMHKVPGNAAKNMLHVCSVEHAMLSTLIFQWDSSNQPLQKVGFLFCFPSTYFNIPNRATGNGWVLPYPPARPVFPALSLLLVGFAIFGYFETKFPDPCLQQKAWKHRS